MAKQATKALDNLYYQARMKAAEYNDKLLSRESAAEELGISKDRLTDYELDLCKVVPVDKVVLMADVYNAPELCALYCEKECPIGKKRFVATQEKSIELATLKLIKSMGSLEYVKDTLLDIAEDGVISDDERKSFYKVMAELDRMMDSYRQLKLIGEKLQTEK